ncbi:MAG: hypothetical protein JWR26_2842 [Pedosphaera sp.]|nr:hypothetical protein [Pedosphaera sp.]
MKNLILCLTVSAFALGSSLHAADTKASTTDKTTDAKKAKVTASGGCSESSCCKGGCAKPVLMSPKAASQAGK